MIPAMSALLVSHARIATMRDGRYSIVEDAGLLAEDGIINWIGPMSAFDRARRASGMTVIEAGGGLVTPGLIDCHTHLVYAGDRAREFERRLAGATYEEIAREGGGIAATVRATRAASNAQLRAAAARRLRSSMADGVTTIEIKSGYGLDLETEMRILHVAQSLAAEGAISVVTTLLGAHAIAPEYAGRREEYVRLVCEEMIPRAAAERLAAAVDGFCERIAFSADDIRRVFEAARSHGLEVKLHADQLSDGGGARLAAEFGALSADHLEYANEEAVEALARAGTVAVLLPGAFYFLRETRLPPIEALRRHRVPMAVATDCNPGTSPCTSILTMLNMACTLFGLTPEEALAGATCNAARALGLRDRGSLEEGKRADLALWDAGDPAELSWHIAGYAPRTVVAEGRVRG
jgi:imidazolonepropionase